MIFWQLKDRVAKDRLDTQTRGSSNIQTGTITSGAACKTWVCTWYYLSLANVLAHVWRHLKLTQISTSHDGYWCQKPCVVLPPKNGCCFELCTELGCCHIFETNRISEPIHFLLGCSGFFCILKPHSADACFTLKYPYSINKNSGLFASVLKNTYYLYD